MKNVIVIGGGLGGMSAALACARDGCAVTLFEKEPHLGGYAVSFERDGFPFDVALHAVAAGAPGEEFHDLLVELGVENEVVFVALPHGFDVHLGDYRFRFPAGYEDLFSALADAFPDEGTSLDRFRRHLEDHAAAYEDVLDDSLSKWRTVPSFLPRIPAFLKHTALPAGDYLAGFFSDRRLRSLLFQPAIFFGVPPSRYPTLNFVMMFRKLLRNGMYTIAGGGQAVTDALVRRLDALGVTVETGMPVDRVLIEEGRAVGVRTATGAEHRAAAVIGNVSTPVLMERLVGSEHLTPTYRESLAAVRPSLSVVQLHVGLDCHVRDVGIESYLTSVFPDDDLEGCMTRQRDSLSVEGYSITAPGLAVAEGDPRRQHVLSVVGGVSGRKWCALRDRDYREAKDEALESLLASLRRRYPDLEAHVRCVDFATPRTFRRYAGTPDGAILGFECTCGAHRSIMAASRHPVRDLHLAGAWTERLGGFLQSMKAGARVGRRVARS